MTVVGYPSEVDKKDAFPIEMGSTQPTGAAADSMNLMIGWVDSGMGGWVAEIELARKSV